MRSLAILSIVGQSAYSESSHSIADAPGGSPDISSAAFSGHTIHSRSVAMRLAIAVAISGRDLAATFARGPAIEPRHPGSGASSRPTPARRRQRPFATGRVALASNERRSRRQTLAFSSCPCTGCALFDTVLQEELTKCEALLNSVRHGQRRGSSVHHRATKRPRRHGSLYLPCAGVYSFSKGI